MLNMMPVSRPERAGDYAKSWGDPLDEVTQELVARCVGLELATLELGLLDEWAQNMPVWTEAKNLEYVFDVNPRGYVSGPGCRPVEDGWT